MIEYQQAMISSLKALQAHALLLSNYGLPSGAHLQTKIEERVAFLDKWMPIYQQMTKFYHVGDLDLRSILSKVAESDWHDLAQMEIMFAEKMSRYRARKDQIIDDGFAAYINNLNRYNEKYRYHARIKQKIAMSKEAFIASLPAVEGFNK